MARLILQFEGRVLRECVMGSLVTIGRLPDNTIIIENPAVSGHHARIAREDDEYVLEDLKSTNGTYVNETHVTRHVLRDGDTVLVGKHTLTFEAEPPAESAAAPLASLKGDTVYLDTQKHRTLLATWRQRQTQASGAPAAGPLGVLRVLAGPSDRPEYMLDARTSLIGASDDAVVRLRGWFKPKVALAIARHGSSYVATPLGGKNRVNDMPLGGRHDLKDGDVLQVSGLTLEFRLVGSAESARPE